MKEKPYFIAEVIKNNKKKLFKLSEEEFYNLQENLLFPRSIYLPVLSQIIAPLLLLFIISFIITGKVNLQYVLSGAIILIPFFIEDFIFPHIKKIKSSSRVRKQLGLSKIRAVKLGMKPRIGTLNPPITSIILFLVKRLSIRILIGILLAKVILNINLITLLEVGTILIIAHGIVLLFT